MEDLIGVALRVSIMYLYVLVLLRLTGKRTFGALTPMDLTATLIVGDVFDDVFWAEIPLAKGVVGASTIILLHTLAAYAGYRSVTFERLISSTKSLVVRNGRRVEEGLRGERMPPGELESELRLRGVERLSEVKEVAVEPDGKVSVLLREEARPVEKRDLPALLREMGK